MGHRMQKRERSTRPTALSVVAGVIAASLLSPILVGQTPATPASLASADIVFRGGVVYTADASRPSARAVAIRAGRIVYVGDDEGVQPFVAVSTRVVDLQGGMLLPGFHDSHVHVLQGGLGMVSCDLSTDATAEAIIAHIARCAREAPEAAWVTGRGWQLSAFVDANPTSHELDAVVPDRPAFFTAADGHSAWLNTRALAAAQIAGSTPDPAGGRIERDPVTGEPTGTLRDMAAGVVLRVLPPPTSEEMEAAVIRGIRLANSFGITSVHEARAQDAMLAAYASLDRRGALNARVTAATAVDLALSDARDVPAEVTRLERLRSDYRGARLRITAAKIAADGALEAQTAALLEPYVNTDDRGPTVMPPDVLTALVVALDRLHFQIHVHAIGDRATRMSLDAFAAARAANGGDGPVHQIAHLQLADAADMPRFRLLRVAANVQGLWAYRDADVRSVEPLIGPDRSQRLYPIGSLFKAGAMLVGGSDWSVSSMNPLLAIQVATTRRGPRAVPGPAWLPDERVSLDAMLAAYTINGARIQFQDEEVGSLVVGKAADLVVLDRNLEAIPAEEIHNAQVRYTFLEGRQVYPADGQ
jgi:predicted amidohydrolase YtcJ